MIQVEFIKIRASTPGQPMEPPTKIVKTPRQSMAFEIPTTTQQHRQLQLLCHGGWEWSSPLEMTSATPWRIVLCRRPGENEAVCVQMIDTTGPSRQKWAVSTATIPEIKSKTTLSGVQLDAATINQTNLIPSIVAQGICVFLCNNKVQNRTPRASPGTGEPIRTDQMWHCLHWLARACQPAWCQVGDKESKENMLQRWKPLDYASITWCWWLLVPFRPGADRRNPNRILSVTTNNSSEEVGSGGSIEGIMFHLWKVHRKVLNQQ